MPKIQKGVMLSSGHLEITRFRASCVVMFFESKLFWKSEFSVPCGPGCREPNPQAVSALAGFHP